MNESSVASTQGHMLEVHDVLVPLGPITRELICLTHGWSARGVFWEFDSFSGSVESTETMEGAFERLGERAVTCSLPPQETIRVAMR